MKLLTVRRIAGVIILRLPLLFVIAADAYDGGALGGGNVVYSELGHGASSEHQPHAVIAPLAGGAYPSVAADDRNNAKAQYPEILPALHQLTSHDANYAEPQAPENAQTWIRAALDNEERASDGVTVYSWPMFHRDSSPEVQALHTAPTTSGSIETVGGPIHHPSLALRSDNRSDSQVPDADPMGIKVNGLDADPEPSRSVGESAAHFAHSEAVRSSPEGPSGDNSGDEEVDLHSHDIPKDSPGPIGASSKNLQSRAAPMDENRRVYYGATGGAQKGGQPSGIFQGYSGATGRQGEYYPDSAGGGSSYARSSFDGYPARGIRNSAGSQGSLQRQDSAGNSYGGPVAGSTLGGSFRQMQGGRPTDNQYKVYYSGNQVEDGQTGRPTDSQYKGYSDNRVEEGQTRRPTDSRYKGYYSGNQAEEGQTGSGEDTDPGSDYGNSSNRKKMGKMKKYKYPSEDDSDEEECKASGIPLQILKPLDDSNSTVILEQDYDFRWKYPEEVNEKYIDENNASIIYICKGNTCKDTATTPRWEFLTDNLTYRRTNNNTHTYTWKVPRDFPIGEYNFAIITSKKSPILNPGKTACYEKGEPGDSGVVGVRVRHSSPLKYATKDPATGPLSPSAAYPTASASPLGDVALFSAVSLIVMMSFVF